MTTITAPHTPPCPCGNALALFHGDNGARCWRCMTLEQAWQRPVRAQARAGQCDGPCGLTKVAVRRQGDGRDLCDVCSGGGVWQPRREEYER